MKRTSSILLACVAALLATAAVAQASTTYFGGAIGGRHVRPHTLALSADGTLEVQRMSWTSWGGATAAGNGTAYYHGCTPSCAQGKSHQAQVSVRLTGRVKCGGRTYYDRVSIENRSGRAMFPYLKSEHWAPCKE